MNRKIAILVLLPLLTACARTGGLASSASLCSNGNSLRIGVDSQLGDVPSEGLPQLSELSVILSKASRCPVTIEPITNDHLGLQGLVRSSWDFAFLGPSLTVLALRDGAGYVPLRSLGKKADSRSAILVNANSPIAGYADLNNKRLGLLPEGSMLGYYLPRYNSYGLRTAVAFGSSFDDLKGMLKAGKVDAIAWDTQATPRPEGTKIAALDPHLLPEAALVMKSDYNSLDYQTMLNQLDGNAFQLPGFLRYAPGSTPRLIAYHHMHKVVRDVTNWDRQAHTESSDAAPHPSHR